MDNKICKYCKFLNITIIPPSSQQYCSRYHKYVNIKTEGCSKYQYNKSLPLKYKEI